ncbi:hypothetical protein CFOL_v3_04144 [Cephalotus follicularis]|uniref:Protein SCAR n=1 Tax=Cephalotus follicularis TaxID=3775 RepID=A0A1Q3AY89_CEPFO|nr:hypothetical protein CFOL_v3_04144 [Cephalotus follicularis]
MPLVRVQVRNEYGLGQAELYREADGEDPKAVLDGVAVAGLVGILRQLGDLAEFAAEVFHGLQEQVTITASRSHKLVVRVRYIEAALPPLEKAVLGQTSHIHFAYTSGCEWHPRIKNEQHHFIYNDLPRFIMDSYEECRDPPRLHLLDKFDTGGPGSCLKRYSDPTFFKRLSGSTIEANADKIQRDKKARKSKKKRILQRNGEIPCGAAAPNDSSRFQFNSPIVNNGQVSPSQTASTVDMTLKSDLGDHSNSFDSRTGSGYIECVFDRSSSMKPEEQECKGFSSRLLQHNGTLDSVFPDEQTQVLDDTFSHGSSQEVTAPNSSSVTWVEKAEVVEPNVQYSERDEVSIEPTNINLDTQYSGAVSHEIVDQKDIPLQDEDSRNSLTSFGIEEVPEMLPTIFNNDTQDSGAFNLETVDQKDISLRDEDSPTSISSRGQVDEIESETDNYMDALNTIESESETDLDCQTKREVEQCFANIWSDRVEVLPEILAHGSDHHPPNVESQTASSISSDRKLPDSVPLESFTYEQTPEISRKASDPDQLPGAIFCASADILDGSRVESAISEPSSPVSRISNLQDPLGEQTLSSTYGSHESHADFSFVHSVKFWTNGSLLGLEPSKPPDFAVSNAGSQDFVTRGRDETVGSQNQAFLLDGDMQNGKLGVLVENAENTEKDVNSHHSKRFNHAYTSDLNVNCTVAPTTELPVDRVVKALSVDANQENDLNSSGVFGFGHRLLMNGFKRQVSFVHDGNSELASSHGGKSVSSCSHKAGILAQRSGNHNFACQAIPDTNFNEQFGLGSTIHSLTSSPPLELMKISFTPLDSVVTSKLKLKFPDANHSHESTRDLFPSFQLVPESAVPFHDISSDSDDDTFCRSSPYMSDGCVSCRFESDSEQWESGETPRSSDRDLYDALRIMSSMECLSSSVQLREAANHGIHINGELQNTYTGNGEEPSLSGPSLDIPSFDTLNAIVQRENTNDADLRSPLNLPNSREPTPTPPPLPPVQWRVSKSQSDVAEDKEKAVSEALEPVFELKLLESSISQEPKPTLSKQQNAFKEDNEQSDLLKLNGQKESYQAANKKGMDEKEDFLQQIRSKSFNLRRTVTTRPAVVSNSTTNVKVTAILEKANAIRQAVGSDDGEDEENWSDS